MNRNPLIDLQNIKAAAYKNFMFASELSLRIDLQKNKHLTQLHNYQLLGVGFIIYLQKNGGA